jgi:hypothetical protein
MWLYHETLANDILTRDFNRHVANSGQALVYKKKRVAPITYTGIASAYERIIQEKVTLETVKEQDDLGDYEPEPLMFPPLLPEGTGQLVFRWREFSERQKESHDNHPAIDIVPDEDSYAWLTQFLLADDLQDGNIQIGPGNITLTDFRLRITDFQFLNVVCLFDSNDIGSFHALARMKVKIIRRINLLIKAIETHTRELESSGVTIRTDDYFGIPNKLNKIVALCFDDMYQYDEPVFLTGVHANKETARQIQRTLEIASTQENQLEDEPGPTIYGINEEPPVFVFRRADPLPLADVLEYLEPMNLLLAERCANESTVQVFYALVELIHAISLLEKKQRRHRTKEENERIVQFDQFKEEDLRIIILKLALILDRCIVRRSSFSGWQNEFINLYYREMDPTVKESAVETKERIKKYDRLLSIYLDEKDQQRQARHSRRQETILGSFTLLTILSVFADIANFLEKDKYDKWNFNTSALEFRLFFIVASLVLLIAVNIFWSPRFRFLWAKNNATSGR